MIGFLAPWLLAGFTALGIPIWIHLTERERKIVRFPSNMFLLRLPYRAARRQKIRHWSLLLLRCLAIFLLVMAFARPFLPRGGWLTSRTAGRDVVLLLDRSYSMEYGDRWQRAVAAAHNVIDKLGEHDRGVVVYFAEDAWTAGGLTGNKAALRAAIDSVRPTAGGTRYDVAFRAAERMIGDTALPRREVVLISDDQRTGWPGRGLPPLPPRTTLTLVELGNDSAANMFVAGVGTHYHTDNGRELVTVTARLVNRGPTALMNHRIALEIGGRLVQAKMVDLPADGTAEVVFDETPVPSKMIAGAVRAADDALARDNVFYFVLTQTVSRPVLVVQPPDADSMTGLFLTTALAIGDSPAFNVRTTRSARPLSDNLQEVALVVLDDAPVPNDEAVRRLLDYVKGGGGLLVALGARSAPDRWPASADELLPRPAGRLVESAVTGGETFGFLDWAHPVFDKFTGPRSGDFSAVRFRRYWPVTLGPADRELARLGDSHVALLERRLGKGRVLVWTSDLDGLWNNLPRQPLFLPFTREVAAYAAGYQEARLTATVGQAAAPAMLYEDDAPSTDSAAPDTRASVARYLAITPSHQTVHFGDPGAPTALELTEQGVYQFQRAGNALDRRPLAVNVDLVESDLTPLRPGLIEAALTRRPAESGTLDTPAGGVVQAYDLEQRQHAWGYLLAAAALLFGLETLISNRLSRHLR